MSSSAANLSSLEKMWEAIIALKPTSTDEEFAKAAAFFSEDTVAYLNAMTAPPAEGRAGVIATLRLLVTMWQMDVHRIRSAGASADGRIIMREMDNRLLILGEPVDNFQEAEFAEFDEHGLIKSYRLYTDSDPIKAILIKKGIMPAPKYD